MFEWLKNPTVVAPLFGLLGVLVAQLFSYLVSGRVWKIDREKLKMDEGKMNSEQAAELRQELRAQNNALSKRLDEVYVEMGNLRKELYQEQKLRQKAELELERRDEEMAEMKAELDRRNQEVAAMKSDLALVKKTAEDLAVTVKENGPTGRA